MVRSIGADHVFDYTREDFAKSGRHYDLIFHLVANRSFTNPASDSVRHGACHGAGTGSPHESYYLFQRRVV
jgi:NADPH:quinone reductase-like Zn-dependent oxidoreductase